MGSPNRINLTLIEQTESSALVLEANRLLRESEERFRRLVEIAPDAVFLHDMTGRVLDANTRACESLGHTREALLGMLVSDFELDFEPPELARRWGSLGSDETLTVKGRHLHRDGTISPVESRICLIEIGGRKAVLANVRDMGEREKSQQRIRESEERFRTAFDHATIGMAIVGIDGRFIQVNQSLCRIVGYGLEEMLSRDFQSITHPDDLQADLVYVQQLLAGKIADYEMLKRYIHRDGRLVWVSLNVALVRGENGKPLYFISQIQDVTARTQAEDALRASEEEFRATFELASVGKLQIDLRTGRIVRVNAKLCQICGYSADELVRMTFTDLTHPDDVEEGRRVALKMLRGEVKEYSAEKRYVRKDGRVIWATINAASLHDGNDRPIKSVVTVQDVTERKMAEYLERDRRRVLEMVALDAPIEKVLSKLASSVEFQVDFPAAVIALQDGLLTIHAPSLHADCLSALEDDRLALAAGLSSSAWSDPSSCGVTHIATEDLWVKVRAVAAPQGFRSCWTYLLRSGDRAPNGLLLVFSRREGRPSPAELQVLRTAGDLARICIDHHTTTRQLAHLVRHDSLTGLPNRVFFQDRLQQAITLAGRSGKPLALLALDVDHFKQINDTLGHDAGDSILRQFAERIRAQLRQTDTIARMGGDEFMIVLPELQEAQGAVVVAAKLVECLREPFRVCGTDLVVTASIGIAAFPVDGSDATALQRTADEQMYKVKRAGRDGYSMGGASCEL